MKQTVGNQVTGGEAEGAHVIRLESSRRPTNGDSGTGNADGSGEGSFVMMDADLKKITEPCIREIIGDKLKQLANTNDREQFSKMWHELKEINDGVMLLFLFIVRNEPERLAKFLKASNATEEEKSHLREWVTRYSVLKGRFRDWVHHCESRENVWEAYKVRYGYDPKTERVLIDLGLYGCDDNVIFHTKDHPESLLALADTITECVSDALTCFSGEDDFLSDPAGKAMLEGIVESIGCSLKSLKAQIAAR